MCIIIIMNTIICVRSSQIFEVQGYSHSFLLTHRLQDYKWLQFHEMSCEFITNASRLQFKEEEMAM